MIYEFKKLLAALLLTAIAFTLFACSGTNNSSFIVANPGVTAISSASSSPLRSATTTSSPLSSPSAQQLNRAAEINIKLGLYYLQQQNFQQAKTKLLLALNQSPQNFLAYDAFAYFLEMTGETGKIISAEKFYKQAIHLALKDGSNAAEKTRSVRDIGGGEAGSVGAAYNNYGTFLYRQKRCAEALAQFKTAIAIPNYLNSNAAYENAGLAEKCARK